MYSIYLLPSIFCFLLLLFVGIILPQNDNRDSANKQLSQCSYFVASKSEDVFSKNGTHMLSGNSKYIYANLMKTGKSPELVAQVTSINYPNAFNPERRGDLLILSTQENVLVSDNRTSSNPSEDDEQTNDQFSVAGITRPAKNTRGIIMGELKLNDTPLSPNERTPIRASGTVINNKFFVLDWIGQKEGGPVSVNLVPTSLGNSPYRKLTSNEITAELERFSTTFKQAIANDCGLAQPLN